VLEMSNQLAVPSPVIEPSAEEKSAVALMAQISTDGVEARAKKLKEAAMLSGLPTEPTEVPEFVTRKVQADRERIEAEIDQVQRKTETETV
jgi:hypothetical protein